MKTIALKAAISVVGIVLLGIHLGVPGLTLDAVALGLVVVAIVPWLSDLVRRLELPSGLKIEFQELRGQVAHQKIEIDRLTEFLFTHFVTAAEFKHLQALHAGSPYPFERASYFDAELRRLRSLGLIAGAVGYLPQSGKNLNDHFQITERGRQYVNQRASLLSTAHRDGHSGLGSTVQ